MFRGKAQCFCFKFGSPIPKDLKTTTGWCLWYPIPTRECLKSENGCLDVFRPRRMYTFLMHFIYNSEAIEIQWMRSTTSNCKWHHEAMSLQTLIEELLVCGECWFELQWCCVWCVCLCDLKSGWFGHALLPFLSCFSGKVKSQYNMVNKGILAAGAGAVLVDGWPMDIFLAWEGRFCQQMVMDLVKGVLCIFISLGVLLKWQRKIMVLLDTNGMNDLFLGLT